MKSAKGFVLSTVRYGDSDAVLHCFTEEEGFQSYFGRGLFSAKSRNKLYLQPLSEIAFSINMAGSRGISNISKIELLKSQDNPDVKTGSILFFLADFLNIILRNEERNLNLYNEIGALKNRLYLRDPNAHLFFMVRTLLLLGLAPLRGGGNYLNLEEGLFEDLPTHQLFDKDISMLWRWALGEDHMFNGEINNALRRSFLNSILMYYQIHVPGFRTPVSLEVVQEVFA